MGVDPKFHDLYVPCKCNYGVVPSPEEAERIKQERLAVTSNNEENIKMAENLGRWAALALFEQLKDYEKKENSSK
jgi:hypothetical protein